MKVLHLENIPRWYAFWWDKAEKCLFLKIYRHFLNSFDHQDLSRHFQIAGVAETDLFTKLESRLAQRTFGFGEHILQVAQDQSSITYKISIPQIVFDTGKTCSECGGTGERSEGMKCLYCDETGKEKVHVWNNAKQLCVSLHVLFSALEFSQETHPDTDESQWFTVATGLCDRGCYLGGQLSPAFVDLLRSKSGVFSDYELGTVEEAQMSAYKKMMGRTHPFDRYSFRSYLSRGNLIINCPGDACGIHPSPYVQEIRPGDGLEMTCHNLDSSHQLLSLLCGWGAVATMFM